MTLMSQIVDAVIAEVQGYTATIDTNTYLTGSLTTSTLTIPVQDASAFSKGIVEIDSELIWIDSLDRVAKTLTVSSTAMRGIRGTTAASHSSGARVLMSPSIPRIHAIRSVEQTILSSQGLFATGTDTFTFVYGQKSYSAPAGADGILSLSWQPIGPALEYIPIRRWTHDKFNEKIVVGDAVQAGRDCKVVYSKAPTVPAQNADFSTSGLPASCEDVIRFGAAWRLMSFVEPTTLFTMSAEADAMKKANPATARLRVAQYFFQMYRARLTEEVAALQGKYPTLVHFGG